MSLLLGKVAGLEAVPPDFRDAEGPSRVRAFGARQMPPRATCRSGGEDEVAGDQAEMVVELQLHLS
ncbi:MAG: hypothetical protein ACJ8H8_33455, partial [Geminicoccaceae bacterium]